MPHFRIDPALRTFRDRRLRLFGRPGLRSRSQRAAQTGRHHPGGNINQRQERQQDRIAEGIENGSLTARESARIESQEARINRQETRFRASGDGLSPRERARLESELSRVPTDPEIAKQMGIGVSDLRGLYQQISFVSLVALDELMTVGGEKGDSLPLIETLQDSGTADPVAAFESEEMKGILLEAINKLPDREKIVVTLYYYEGLTLAEIGQVLGVTESRICQMHTKAVLQLRSRMSDSRRD